MGRRGHLHVAQHLLLPTEFLCLVIGEGLLVGRTAIEGQLVDWILRSLLDKYVALTIVPIWVFVLVVGPKTFRARHLVPLVRVSSVAATFWV